MITTLQINKAKEVYEKGLNCYNEGDYHNALTFFTKSIFLVPEEPLYYKSRAEVYLALGDIKSAISNLKKAVSIDKTDVHAAEKLSSVLDGQGILYHKEKKFESAINCYDEAILHNPSNKMVYLHRAITWISLKKNDHALDDLELCENARECFPYVNVIRGNIYMSTNELLLAKEELNKALQEGANHPDVSKFMAQFKGHIEAYKQKATELMLRMKFDDAIRTLDEAIQVCPSDAMLLFKRAACFRRLRQFPAAIKDLLESININGGSYPESEKQLALTLNEIGIELYSEYKFQDAISYFSEGIKWNPNASSLYVNRGDCYHKLLMHEKALLDFKMALEKDPNDANCRSRLANLFNEWGVLLYNDGLYNLAMKEFTKAIRYCPIARFYANRAKALLFIKKTKPLKETDYNFVSQEEREMELLAAAAAAGETSERSAMRNEIATSRSHHQGPDEEEQKMLADPVIHAIKDIAKAFELDRTDPEVVMLVHQYAPALYDTLPPPQEWTQRSTVPDTASTTTTAASGNTNANNYHHDLTSANVSAANPGASDAKGYSTTSSSNANTTMRTAPIFTIGTSIELDELQQQYLNTALISPSRESLQHHIQTIVSSPSEREYYLLRISQATTELSAVPPAKGSLYEKLQIQRAQTAPKSPLPSSGMPQRAQTVPTQKHGPKRTHHKIPTSTTTTSGMQSGSQRHQRRRHQHQQLGEQEEQDEDGFGEYTAWPKEQQPQQQQPRQPQLAVQGNNVQLKKYRLRDARYR